MPSKVILAMRYDPAQEELLIAFRAARGVYRYFNVPIEEWEGFLEAESKGTYLNCVFKQKEHPYERTHEVIQLSEQSSALPPLVWGEAAAPRKHVHWVEASRQEQKVRA